MDLGEKKEDMTATIAPTELPANMGFPLDLLNCDARNQGSNVTFGELLHNMHGNLSAKIDFLKSSTTADHRQITRAHFFTLFTFSEALLMAHLFF